MLTRMAKIWIGVAVLLLLSMPMTFASSPREMDFDGIQIALGQASNHALSRLHGTFDLQPVYGQSGSYTIQTKGNSGKVLGIITFRNGKVVQLERERGNAVDVGQGKIMTTLMNELVKEGNTHAEITLDKQLKSGIRYDIITLKVPGKRILITISNPSSDSGKIIYREILE